MFAVIFIIKTVLCFRYRLKCYFEDEINIFVFLDVATWKFAKIKN